MEALGSAASIVSVIQITGSLIKICWGYVGEVKDAKDDIQYLIKVVEDLQIVLTKLHSLLDGENGQKLPITQVLSRTILECQWDLERLNEKLHATRPNKKNVGNQKRDKVRKHFNWRSITWPFERKEVEKIVTRIERYKRVFLTALQLDLVNVTARMDRKVDLAKLPTVDEAVFGSYMDQHEDECLEQTRTELLHDTLVWSADINSKFIFWLNGMAGTGKSTIARTIARLLKEEKRLGASFFFKRGEGDRGHSTQFFTTIVKQLVSEFPPLGPLVAKAVEDDPAIGKKSLREQFDTLLLHPLSQLECGDRSLSPLVIVIDALDECEKEQDIRTILALLPGIKSSGPIQLRIFITSRPELPIRLGFKQIHDDDHQDTVLHEIPENIIQQDLMIYFQFRLSAIREEHGLPDGWPGEDITQTLVRMAIPLFIFAATICRFIGDLKWEPDERLGIILQTRLKNDTTPLERTYAPILDNLLSGPLPEIQKSSSMSFKGFAPLQLYCSALVFAPEKSQVRFIFKDNIPNWIRRLPKVDTSWGTVRQTLEMQGGARALAFSSNGKLVAAVSSRNTIELWDATSGLIQQSIAIPHGPLRRRWAFSPDCKLAASIIDESVTVWDTVSCLVRQTFECHDRLSTGAFSSNDKLVALASGETIILWDVNSGLIQQTLKGHTGQVRMIAFSLDGKLIASTAGEAIKLWDASSGLIQHTIESHSFASYGFAAEGVLAFSPDIKLVFSVSENNVELWDINSGRMWEVPKSHDDPVITATFSPEGKLIASGSYHGIINLWDTTSGLIMATIQGYNSLVMALVFSPDSESIASIGVYGPVTLWDTTSVLTQQTSEHQNSMMYPAVSSPNKKFVAFPSSDKTVKLWNVTSGLFQQTFEGWWNRTGPVRWVAFSPDSKLIASVSSESTTVKLWDITSGLVQQTFENHDSPVEYVAFSPDGKLVAAVSHKTVTLWDTTSGLIHLNFRVYDDNDHDHDHYDEKTNYISGVAFSPDTRLIALASSDNTIKLWNTTSGLIQQILTDHSDDNMNTVAFSHDRKLLASASYEGTIKLWDINSGLVKQTIAFDGVILSMQFSPQDEYLETNHGIFNLQSIYTGHGPQHEISLKGGGLWDRCLH
ncbi:vegetative incompatibility protein HET-E-1 [Paecilomyces variotii No. 5]|uniref:Vegetative incompatibility protein HET-E-1 n=1 Tax=Byssochlamys spectabilis (strain No. 5 / NBRC 109023) TaxID=1356009 RepID=V5G3K2_BYSSN|nr:vegetative incompatibility protein HET-E-1 [Paecilomyces variotii No. 5]